MEQRGRGGRQGRRDAEVVAGIQRMEVCVYMNPQREYEAVWQWQAHSTCAEVQCWRNVARVWRSGRQAQEACSTNNAVMLEPYA